MGSLEQLALVKELLDVDPLKLNRVRLINVDMADADLSVLFRLAALGGVDDSGLDTDMAVITGRFYAVSAMEGDIANCRALYPGLEIDVETELEDPTTVFEFVSSQNLPLNYVLFNPSIPFTKIDDTHYSAKAVAGTVITFVIEAENHEGYAGTYEVTYTRTRRYSLIYVPVRPVVFRNAANSNPLEGVVVHVDNETYISDVDGTAYIRKREAFTATGTLEEFGNATFSMNESSTDTAAVTVYVYPYVDVELIVKSSGVFVGGTGTFVQGATVIFNGETKMTDLNGIVTFRASYGRYNYEIFLHEDKKTTGALQVYTADTKGQILNLAVDLNDIRPVLDGESIIFHGFHSNPNFYLVCTSDSAFTVDWGDGTTQTLGPASNAQIIHSYPPINNIVHLIKLIDCEGVTSFYGQSYSYIAALWTIGNSKVIPALSSSSYLIYIGRDVFGNLMSTTSLSGAFQNATNLAQLEDGIFDGLVSVQSIRQTFTKATSLKRLPAHCFADMLNLQDLYSCFESSGIEEPDDDLFRDHRKISVLHYAFRNCPNLKHVKRGVLPLETDDPITQISYTFYGCSKLETIYIPASIAALGEYLLYGCSSLQYIEMESETPPTLAAYTFYNASPAFVVYVPDVAVDTYREATNWNSYADKILPVSQKPAQ
jgi:hypothetical protein